MTEDGKKPTELDETELEQASGGGKKPPPAPPPPPPAPRPLGDFNSDGDVDGRDY